MALLLFAAVGWSGAGWADTTYWRVTMDRVTVVANGSARRCTKLATQFLVFESILRQLAGWGPDFVLPPVALYSLSQQDAQRVLLSGRERQRQRGASFMVYSKYLPGRELNINAIVDVGGSDDPLQSVLLLYAEGTLTSGPSQRDPPWYQLGVANLLNGITIRDDGSVLLNRRLPFEPTAEGSHGVHYDLEKLLELSPAELDAVGNYKEFVRRSREWAQFGLLTTADRRSHYRELVTRMRQGESASDAVKDAFGMTLARVATEFESRRWKKEVQFRFGAPVPTAVVPVPEELDPTEANTLLQVVATRASGERHDSM